MNAMLTTKIQLYVLFLHMACLTITCVAMPVTANYDDDDDAVLLTVKKSALLAARFMVRQ